MGVGWVKMSFEGYFIIHWLRVQKPSWHFTRVHVDFLCLATWHFDIACLEKALSHLMCLEMCAFPNGILTTR